MDTHDRVILCDSQFQRLSSTILIAFKLISYLGIGITAFTDIAHLRSKVSS